MPASRPRGSEMGWSAPVTSTAPAPVPRPLWKRLLKSALVIAALVVVFGWLLPVHRLRGGLGRAHAARCVGGVVLLGLALARVPTEALMYRAFLPGLGLRRGSEAYLSSNFAGQLLRLRARASSSTATSAAEATHPTPPGSRRWARSCSRRSAGSCFRSSRSYCCSSPVRSTARSRWRARSRSWSRPLRASPATSSCAGSARRAGSEPRRNGRSPGSW